MVPEARAQDLNLGREEDLAQLEEHEIAPDLEGVRLFLVPPGPGEEDVKLARLWAAQLGSNKFSEREAASQKLLAMGLDALAAVEQASKSQDAETRVRARGILLRLNRLREKRDAALPAVLRTIVRQEMKGLAPELLHAARRLPTDAAEQCLQRALWVSAQPQDADLLRQALTEGTPAVRRAAALALPAALGEEARQALLPLLTHDDLLLRYAAAQAVAPLAREAAFETLLQGMQSEALPERMAAGRVFHHLTGQSLGFVAYDTPARRGEAITRVQTWLAQQDEATPLRQPLAEGPLPRGRFLLCHFDPYSASELDETGRLWFRRQSVVPEDEAYCGCAVSPEGHRVLAGFGYVVAFSNRENSAEAWRFAIPETPAAVDRTPQGTYLVGLFDDSLLREMSATGEVLREVKLAGNPNDVRYLSEDRVLACLYSTKQVIEIDNTGAVVWKIDNVPPPESARRLANGNTLVSSTMKVVEYNPGGEEVWSYNKNIPMAYDALELPNGNVLIGFRRGLREVDRSGDTVREWTASTVRRICAY